MTTQGDQSPKGRDANAARSETRAPVGGEAADATNPNEINWKARAEKAEAALRHLAQAARDVRRFGAQTGPQWHILNTALIRAEAALGDR